MTAHLPKEAGGRGIPVASDGGFLLPSSDDPDYRTMLESIETGKRLSLETPRADMPGFAGARPEP